MEEQLISLELFKIAQLKGFKNPLCLLDKWMNISFRPTHSKLQSWILKNNGILISVSAFNKKFHWFMVVIETDEDLGSSNQDFNSYEEALENGMSELFKLI